MPLQVTDMAASCSPYTFNQQEVARKNDPNKKLKWLVPILFAAQLAFKVGFRSLCCRENGGVL